MSGGRNSYTGLKHFTQYSVGIGSGFPLPPKRGLTTLNRRPWVYTSPPHLQRKGLVSLALIVILVGLPGGGFDGSNGFGLLIIVFSCYAHTAVWFIASVAGDRSCYRTTIELKRAIKGSHTYITKNPGRFSRGVQIYNTPQL